MRIHDPLSEELVLVRGLLPSLVAAMERTVPYAAAWVSRMQGLQIIVSDREQHIAEVLPSQGAVFTAWNGEFLEEAATSDLSRGILEKTALDLAKCITFRHGADGIDPGDALTQEYVTRVKMWPSDLSPQERLEFCIDLHARTRRLDPRIINVQVRYTDGAIATVFANRAKLLSQFVQRVRLLVLVMVSDGEKMRYDYLSRDGTGGMELLEVSDDDLRRLCDTAVALLSAERIEPGFYNVICTPDVSGVMAHEAFGHGVEMDMFLKDRAKSREFLGKRIAPPHVNILDDPSYPGGFGSYFFDDEGQLASPTYIIRDGIFERGLTDLYSAHVLGFPRSANGRRESFARKVYARMSNTFFGRGTTPVSEMVASMERGIYLKHVSSGMEDPKGWGVQLTCHYGEEIANGKPTGRLFHPIGVTGYVPDVLNSISMVGNDFALDGGNCGKGHKEWVPVSSGGPHLKMKVRLG
ncbi:MAG: TldD/PmbA family protein [Chloroflexi bacterium]|nr:TldD/PmbA family protein [Chloroflexota bacterium]